MEPEPMECEEGGGGRDLCMIRNRRSSTGRRRRRRRVEGGDSILREVKEQLWQAGKYAAVGIVVLTTLPVLIPSVFVLSVLLITFLLPLVCGIGGFLYLQKHAATFYRFLPGARSPPPGVSGDLSFSHRRRLIRSPLFGGFPFLRKRKDADSTDTCEEVDQDFDAVLVTKKSKFGKIVPESAPWTEAARQFESRKEERPVHEDEQMMKSARDERFMKYVASGDVKLEQGKREGKLVGTVPEAVPASRAESSLREREGEGGVHLVASCTGSGEGFADVQGLKGKKIFGDGELAEVSDYGVEGIITSEDSRAVHPKVVATDRHVVSSSALSGPESMTLDYKSLEMFRLEDESASDDESFESTSDAPFRAGKSRKEADLQRDEDHRHRLRSQSPVRIDDDELDHSSLADEDRYHYEELPVRGYTAGEVVSRTPEMLRKGKTCSLRPCPFEDISGYPSTSRGSEASEEKAGMMKSSKSASAFSEDMYDIEEQLHLQQFARLLQFWREKEFQAGLPVCHAKARNQQRFRFFQRPQGHDEEEQLRRELKAIKTVVGDEDASGGAIVSDIEELSQILGIELPSMGDGIKEIEWARVAVEVIKVVVGME